MDFGHLLKNLELKRMICIDEKMTVAETRTQDVCVIVRGAIHWATAATFKEVIKLYFNLKSCRRHFIRDPVLGPGAPREDCV